MRVKAVLLCVLLLASCATLEKHPNPLTAEDVIARAKSGVAAKAIIEELFRTDTVIPLNAAEVVRMHEAGVPDEVLDYMQHALIEEIRARDRFANSYWWYGPGFYPGFGPCPWPPSRRHRGAPWGC